MQHDGTRKGQGGSTAIQQNLQAAFGHQQAGRLAQAEAIYRQILQEQPNHPDALNLLAAIARQTGRLDEAVALYRKLLALLPDNVGVLYNLGNALQMHGRMDEAVTSYARAVKLKPDFAEAHCNRASALLAQHKVEEAIAGYRRAIALKPDYAEAHGNLGTALQSQGKLEDAIASYRRAIVLKPDYAKAHGNLGKAMYELNRLDEAIEHDKRAVALNPKQAETWSNLGGIYYDLAQLDDAANAYRQALAANPALAEALTGLASVNIALGKFDEAQASLAQAMQLRPDYPDAWAAQTELRKMTVEDAGWLENVSAMLRREVLSTKQKIRLQFALGKYYDDTRQYALAFPAYRAGNELKRQLEGGLDRAALSALVDTMIARYDADFLAQAQAGASTSELPVLIVGMLRSGTSLTEQILASHPDVFGAGELPFWGNQLSQGKSEIVLAGGAGAEPCISAIAREYEQLLRGFSAEAKRIVDKQPTNFLLAGLVHAVFPHARIIHTLRNPIDTCLSIYFQNLRQGHSYGTDLEDLAFYYREYVRLMAHWRRVLPADRLLEVSYEALIGDQAGWSRRIIDFIGLPWDERCLDFHQTERKVGTSSNWQVRQKIYQTSRERWRNYEEFVGPLMGLLDLE